MTSRDGSPVCSASNASDLHSEVDLLDSIYCGPRFGHGSFIDDQQGSRPAEWCHLDHCILNAPVIVHGHEGCRACIGLILRPCGFE